MGHVIRSKLQHETITNLNILTSSDLILQRHKEQPPHPMGLGARRSQRLRRRSTRLPRRIRSTTRSLHPRHSERAAELLLLQRHHPRQRTLLQKRKWNMDSQHARRPTSTRRRKGSPARLKTHKIPLHRAKLQDRPNQTTKPPLQLLPTQSEHQTHHRRGGYHNRGIAQS